MKKIMFNDKYGLTQAVLEGRKTMTRRLVGNRLTEDDIKAYQQGKLKAKDIVTAHYKIGEVVAIAQRYSELSWDSNFYNKLKSGCELLPQYELKGWDNKMFVKAELMPHCIRITGIKVERLQDISDEDVYREGFRKEAINNGWGNAAWHWEAMLTYMDNLGRYKDIRSDNPKEAFSFLIDKVSGNGTWESNPWMFVYEFKHFKYYKY